MRDVYYVGEKPSPEPFEIRKEIGGGLIETFNGWTFKLFVKNGSQAEAEVPCTNNGDGTGAINWPTSGGGVFIEEGTIDCWLRGDDGGGGHIEWIDHFIAHVKVRNA